MNSFGWQYKEDHSLQSSTHAARSCKCIWASLSPPGLYYYLLLLVIEHISDH